MSWAGRAGLPSLNATLRSRERGGKVIPPSRPALGRRVLATEKLIRSLCAAPFGRHVLYRDWVAAIWLTGLAPGWGGAVV